MQRPIPEGWSVIVNDERVAPLDEVKEIVRDFLLVAEESVADGTSQHGKTPPWLNADEVATLSEVEQLQREVAWWKRRALRAEGMVRRIHDEGESFRGFLDLLAQEWSAHQEFAKCEDKED